MVVCRKPRREKLFKYCVKCSKPIPNHKRSDAKYCSNRCKEAAEKKRYCDRNPDYVKRQRLLVCEIRHMKEYGHTRFVYNPMENGKDRFAAARALGFRSMLEVHIADSLKQEGVDYKYEQVKIKYDVNEVKEYVADFKLPNGIIIEAKGRFKPEDRKKHLLIKEQHPELDIRFVFSNPNAKLGKGAKSTCADWCEKHGFRYSKEKIPADWIDE